MASKYRWCTANLLPRTFMIDGKPLKFHNGIYKGSKSDEELVKKIDPAFPILDEIGRIVNMPDRKLPKQGPGGSLMNRPKPKPVDKQGSRKAHEG